MNANMATLLKSIVAVLVVVSAITAGTSALFRTSPEAGLGRPSVSAAPPATTPQASGAVPAGPQPPAGAATATNTAPARPAPPPPRTSTDFSAADAPWDRLLAQPGDAAQGQALATSGKSAAGVAACASCHGQQGIPAAGAAFPVLAGATPPYLAKQLLDYRSGARQQPLMGPIAKGLDDQDIASLARYYGSLPPPPLQAATAGAGDRGQRLHDFGDNALALAACANCHGARGVGESPSLPRLAGQPEAYFTAQIEAFRDGQRANDDAGTMQAIAKRLSADDTAALARYYAGMRR